MLNYKSVLSKGTLISGFYITFGSDYGVSPQMTNTKTASLNYISPQLCGAL